MGQSQELSEMFQSQPLLVLPKTGSDQEQQQAEVHCAQRALPFWIVNTDIETSCSLKINSKTIFRKLHGVGF